MMTQQEAQELNYHISTMWHAGIVNLTCGEVDLGDVMQYDVLRVGGSVIKQHLEGAQGDDRSQPGNDRDGGTETATG